MNRTLPLSLCAVLAVSSATCSANSHEVTQAQFRALQKQVVQLKKVLQKSSDSSTPTSQAHQNRASNKKSDMSHRFAGKLFVEDGYYGTEFWEASNSSDLPHVLMKDKKAYASHVLALGGFFEMEPINSWWGDAFSVYSGTGSKVGTLATGGDSYQNGIGLGISAARVDMMANLGQWGQVFIEPELYAGSHHSAQLVSAFVNIGNLFKSPFYLTLGKFRPRLGKFPGGPWVASIPQGIFRPGFINNAMLTYAGTHLNAYFAYIPQSCGQSQAMMVSAFYKNQWGNSALSYSADLGYMTNVTLSGNQVGSALEASSPAINIDAGLNYKNVGIDGGWVSTLKSRPISQNAHASAWWTQLSYSTNILTKKVTLAANYSRAKNTQNIAMPLAGNINQSPSLYGVKDVFFTYAMTRLTRNINVGLEYARMHTYDNKKSNEITVYTAFYF